MLNQQVNAAGVPDIDNLVRAASSFRPLPPRHRRLNFVFYAGEKVLCGVIVRLITFSLSFSAMRKKNARKQLGSRF